MKKTMLALFACLVMLISLMLPFAAIEYGQAANGTPVIDGKIDDIWASTPSQKINKLKSGEEATITAEFKVLWDSKLLYILITVTDPEISFEGEAHHLKDGVEIYFDPMKVRTDNYDEEPLVMQCFIIPPPDQPMEFSGNSDSIEAFEPKAQRVLALTDKGYIVEASFDLKTICPDLKMEAGTVIALDVQANDQVTGEVARLGAYGWSDDEDSAWHSSEILGEITFLAAKVEEPPTEAEPAEDITEPKNPKTSDSFGILSIILTLVSFSAIIKISAKRTVK